MEYPQRVIVGLCLVAVALGAFVGSREQGVSATIRTVDSDVSVTVPDSELTIHISGLVVEPGVVVVPDGSIVADVVKSAGGALPDARLDLLNLSRPVIDGEHIDIPGTGQANGGSGGFQTDDGLVRINQATTSELEQLPGVGPVLAGRIVAHRESVGLFDTVEDLLDVSGIGEAKLKSLRDYITIP